MSPSPGSQSARVIASKIYEVFVRKVRSGAPPEMGLLTSASSGEDGWAFATNLRLRQIRLQQGSQPGWATFDYVPLAGIEPIESMLSRYGVDDQVRVIQIASAISDLASGVPEDDILPGAAEATGIVVFEGVLSRSGFMAERSGDKEREGMTLTAMAAPEVDDTHPDHKIRGRWVADPDNLTDTPLIIDGPSVPAVFNSGGRPNKHAAALITAAAPTGAMGMVASIFTSDDDPKAEYWTVKEAMLSIIVMWLYGQGATLERSAALEYETYEALTNPAGVAGDRWVGLDARMPSVSVQGLGVYEAIDAVCRAAGYNMAVTTSGGRALPDTASAFPDRLYELRIWRIGAGPSTVIKMMKRYSFTGVSADEVIARNNVSMIEGMRDAADVRNRVVAVGRTYIESSFPLKPLWRDDDIDAAAVTDQHGHLMVGQQGTVYHQRHVDGGPEYAEYLQVGRHWGLDGTGQFVTDALGYPTPAIYAQEVGGFDYLAFLGLDAGTDAIAAERTTRGVTDPIRWVRRTRRPLPITRPTIEKLTNGMILECSEDGGASWTRVELQFRVLKDFFGIALTDSRLSNLANVNLKTFTDDRSQPDPTPAGGSWWALLQLHKLQFRLTCRILADHATRFDAPPQATGTTQYDRMSYVPTDIEETWVAPGSFFNAGSSFVKIHDTGFGTTAESADRSLTIQDVAERRRDASEGLRLSATYDTWQMTLAPWRVGDRVLGIQGRNLSFATSAGAGGGELRYPTIVGITLTAWPEESQGISVDLDDTAMRRGA